MRRDDADPVVVQDFGEIGIVGADGVVWSAVGEQLNANLVKLDAGAGIDEHVNDAVEVLLVTQAGRGVVEIDGVAHRIEGDTAVLVPRGSRRSIRAETRLLYFSIHVRPGGLEVGGVGGR